MKRSLRRFALLPFLALAVLLSSCTTAPQPSAQAPGVSFGFQKGGALLQVGFVTVGPTSDWGYNYQHNQGRLGLEARMRDKVKTAIVENVPETADVERVMQRMVDEGAGLIYSTSYGYADSSLRVAAKNPSVIFMQALGTERSANLGTYSLRVWEPAYVAGAVAAATFPKQTRFGFVGAHPVPPIFWTVNAFALGAQSVNKDVTVDMVFTNSWNNPSAETEAVRSLAGQGVKVIYVLVDSPIAAVQAAEQAGVHVLAHFADLSSFAPKYWLTGSIWSWTKLYVDVTSRVIGKTWNNQHVGGGFKEGYVELAPFGPAVTTQAQALARTLIDRIRSEKLDVYGGPVVDSEGKQRAPVGQALNLDTVLSMDWAVKGVRRSGSK